MRSPLLDLRPRSVRTRGSSGFATAPHLIYPIHIPFLTHFMRFLYTVPFRRRSALNPFTDSFIVGAIYHLRNHSSLPSVLSILVGGRLGRHPAHLIGGRPNWSFPLFVATAGCFSLLASTTALPSSELCECYMNVSRFLECLFLPCNTDYLEKV